MRADGTVFVNLEDRMLMPGFCEDTHNMLYDWSVSLTVNLSIPRIAPLGFLTPHFILQPNPTVLIPGRKDVVSCTATTQFGDVVESCLTV